MSYTVYAYLVDLERLRGAYGCKDMNIVLDIERVFASQLEEDETPREVWISEKGETRGRRETRRHPEPTLRQALQDIVNGTLRPVQGKGQYVYALELLCHYLGQSLPNDPFQGFSGVGILEEFAGLEPLADYSRRPLPIPNLLPPDGFPAVTYLTCGEALGKLTHVQLIEPSSLYDDPKWEAWEEEWIDEAYEVYRSWLERSVSTQRDLVAFLY